VSPKKNRAGAALPALLPFLEFARLGIGRTIVRQNRWLLHKLVAERVGFWIFIKKPEKNGHSSNLARISGYWVRGETRMNRTLSLLRYAATGKGWRRGAVVLSKNGKLKADTMLVSGVEVHCPKGRYQMRKYEGTRPVYIDLGNDPSDALNRYRAEETKKNAREQAIRAGLEVVTPDDTKNNLQQYAQRYLEMHRSLPHRSDDSVRVYTNVTSTFLHATKAKYPEDVNQEDVVRWYGKMRETGYSDRTRSNLYLALRGFLRYCGIDPSKVIDKGTHTLMQKYTKKIPNMYTPEQVAVLVEASTANNESNLALLWDFAYKTGLRDSELQMVTRHDLHGLDTTEPMLHVKERNEYGQIKDSEERGIELHPSLVRPLNKWLKENPKRVLLFGTDNDRPDTKMLRALKRTARNAGLNCGRCSGCTKHGECGEFTLHRFRRTYVTRMLLATHGDLPAVMKRSGHSDIESVMRYLAPASTIRTAVSRAF
jgi:integrase